MGSQSSHWRNSLTEFNHLPSVTTWHALNTISKLSARAAPHTVCYNNLTLMSLWPGLHSPGTATSGAPTKAEQRPQPLPGNSGINVSLGRPPSCRPGHNLSCSFRGSAIPFSAGQYWCNCIESFWTRRTSGLSWFNFSFFALIQVSRTSVTTLESGGKETWVSSTYWCIPLQIPDDLSQQFHVDVK